MPNKKGGKRIRRGKKNADTEKTKHIMLKEVGQQYCRVLNMLGDCRISLITDDGKELIGIIRGKFRKRVWINRGDIVVVANRTYQDNRVDVIHKYHPTEVKQLVKRNQIPRTLLSTEDGGDDGNGGEGDDGGIAWNVDGDGGDGDEEDARSKIYVAPQREIKDIDEMTSEDEDDYDNVDMKDLLDKL